MIFLLFLFIDIFCCLVVFAWKAIPSEARVTRDEVSGYITHMGETVWKTVPSIIKSVQSDKSVVDKKDSEVKTNTD